MMDESGFDPADETQLRGLLGAAARAVPTGDADVALAAVRRRGRRRRFTNVTALVAVGGVTAAMLLSGGDGRGVPARGDELPPYRLAGALTSFSGCTDYLRYVRDRGTELVGPYGLPGTYGWYGNTWGDSRWADSVWSSGGFTLLRGRAVAVPAPAGAGGAPGAPVVHSDTTVQVAGVDEPDTVKTDGRLVVSLTGNTVRILDTHAQVLGTLRLAGDTGGGLLLTGDRVVVLSSATSGGWSGSDWTGSTWNPSGERQQSRASVIDISDPEDPTLVRTFDFDGVVVASRLVGGEVRVVLRTDAPRITFQMATGNGDTREAKEANRHLVATSTLEDWLPAWRVESPDGSTTARQPLARCDAVARPRQASGIATVSVFDLDPTSAEPAQATSVVAAGDTVYANTGHVYIAGTTYGDPDAKRRPCCLAYSPKQRTWIYDFATTGTDRPRYLGAGWVPGTLLNSYSMDEDAAGYLRVATTVQDRHGRKDSRISVLERSGDTLGTVGVVDGLGHNQDVKTVRFIGDKAYVVTFRNFDPLYVVDLGDPQRPAVAGRLEQPGFSTFLYPLPHDRLLGIGITIDHSEPSGLDVSTYDVSDPAHPTRLDRTTVARGFFSGDFDPHAFLYWDPTRLAVVSLPGTAAPHGVRGAGAYRVGDAGRLTHVAALAHKRLVPTRTMVLGNRLWAFTAGGVIVADLDALGTSHWHAF